MGLKTGPKWGFSGFVENYSPEFFWFFKMKLGEGNLFFLLYGQSGELFQVGKMIIVIFRVSTCRHENIDHWGKGMLCLVCQFK